MSLKPNKKKPETQTEKKQGPGVVTFVDELSLTPKDSLLPVQIEVESMGVTLLLDGKWRLYDKDNEWVFSSQNTADSSITISKKAEVSSRSGFECPLEPIGHKWVCSLHRDGSKYPVFMSGRVSEDQVEALKSMMQTLSQCSSGLICDLRI